MTNVTEVQLRQSPTELYKILKFEGIAPSGALAKQMIADGMIKVNGETELRKRRQINAGDMIEIDQQQLLIR